MKKVTVSAFTALALGLMALPAFSAEVCTVSMMGRVCYEEGSPEATAAHMKGDAVAESQARKKADLADAKESGTKKVATSK